MKIFNVIFNCFLATFFLSGCAPTRTWISSPEFQSADNATYSARFTPLRGSGQFIAEFRLEVKNKTRQPLEIDWNSTRYLYNQGPSGRFAFEGINAAKDHIPGESDRLAARTRIRQPTGFQRRACAGRPKRHPAGGSPKR
jgi:hypothetical protein